MVAGEVGRGTADGRTSGLAATGGADEAGLESAGRGGKPPELGKIGPVAGKIEPDGGKMDADGAAKGGFDDALGLAGPGVAADGEAVKDGGGSFAAGASPPIIVALSEIRSGESTGLSSGDAPGALSPNNF